MSSGLLVFLEFLLVVGLVLGFAAWELLSLRRDKDKDDPPR
jgi:hypothetical protein